MVSCDGRTDSQGAARKANLTCELANGRKVNFFVGFIGGRQGGLRSGTSEAPNLTGRGVPIGQQEFPSTGIPCKGALRGPSRPCFATAWTVADTSVATTAPNILQWFASTAPSGAAGAPTTAHPGAYDRVTPSCSPWLFPLRDSVRPPWRTFGVAFRSDLPSHHQSLRAFPLVEAAIYFFS